MTPVLGRAPLADYLAGVFRAPVEVIGLRTLGGDVIDDPKGFGYGVPLQLDCRVAGTLRSLVVTRTRPTSAFGHEYPADRAWQALHGHDAYNDFPRHSRSLDVGFVRAGGELVSAADAVDFFQIVDKIEGDLYWHDLDRMLHGPASALDTERARSLAGFLAKVHASKRDDPALYARRVRELVGHGECVMGILDALPHPWPPLPPEMCEALESAFVRWRWRLRGRAHRLAQTHGDFHPWNILFRDGTDFSVLDRSRGQWGEPCDDVAALAVNYLCFGMRRAASHGERGAAEPFRTLFHTFLSTYLDQSRDAELFETLPPFLAFRALVLAHPRWYPDVAPAVRDELIHAATWLATSRRFEPADGARLCGASR